MVVEKYSGKKLRYFDPEINDSYIPYVVETSIGLDRMFLAVLSSSFVEEKLENQTSRTVLNIPPFLAPYKLAVLPLVKKDGLPEYARNIFDDFKLNHNIYYDEKDAIGRRYRRQDALGTPICLTVDHDSLRDNSITLRFRDSMQQIRVSIDDISSEINNRVGLRNFL